MVLTASLAIMRDCALAIHDVEGLFYLVVGFRSLTNSKRPIDLSVSNKYRIYTLAQVDASMRSTVRVTKRAYRSKSGKLSIRKDITQLPNLELVHEHILHDTYLPFVALNHTRSAHQSQLIVNQPPIIPINFWLPKAPTANPFHTVKTLYGS